MLKVRTLLTNLDILTNFFGFLDFALKHQLLHHQQSMHATMKDWTCDCCGSRFGTKAGLMKHVKSHLPPSFPCSTYDKKFYFTYKLKNHEKLHQGVNELCKHCKQGFPTKNSLYDHIYKHFERLHCEVNGCLTTFGCKRYYKDHLRKFHKNDNQVLIENLLSKLKKLIPDHKLLKYVQN